jgi:PRTRC genetic system protein B
MGKIETLNPVKALIFFENDYIEERNIKNGVMGVGKPLSISSAKQLGDSLVQANFSSVRGLIPENLIYCDSSPGQEVFAWFKPASKQNLYFHDKLKIKDGLYPVPPLLFIASNGRMDIFALKENNKPQIESVLYLAPFHNVNSNGNVCLGSSKNMKKPKSFEDFIISFEILFFNSRFTHANNSDFGLNINSLWRSLKGKKEFPVEKLIETKKKLKDFIR